MVTLPEIDKRLEELGRARNVVVRCHQTNSEGGLVDLIQTAVGKAQGLIVNAGAYTHTSIAVGDALAAVALPAVEVHLSNLQKRERFRHHSYVAPHCIGTISGFGARSYYLALDALIDFLQEKTIP
jgi:3-dehydroquinate dehydratase-2